MTGPTYPCGPTFSHKPRRGVQCAVGAACVHLSATNLVECVPQAKDPCAGVAFTCACAIELCGSEGLCISATEDEGGHRLLDCFTPGI